MPDHAGESGYRQTPRGGPAVRTDIVEVYVFRRAGRNVEFLQLHRATEPLKGTWQPIMGHVEQGETAVRAAVRELAEEVSLWTGDEALVGIWALEQVHPYYVAAVDAIVLGPRFAAEVRPGWEPKLNPEHAAARWARDASAFLWPGQRCAAEELVRGIADEHSPARAALRLTV